MDVFSLENIIGQIDNMWSLMGLVIVSIVYIIIILYNRKQYKKHYNKLISKFEDSIDKILNKFDELKDSRNTLDTQSSMDIIKVIGYKSMFKVMDSVKQILEEDDLNNLERREFIYNKVRNVVNSQYDDDLIILSRIFHKNNRLSLYIVDLKRYELADEIYKKLIENNDNKFNDIIDFIKSKYHQYMQSALLQLSS